jgi:hypothetical protein
MNISVNEPRSRLTDDWERANGIWMGNYLGVETRTHCGTFMQSANSTPFQFQMRERQNSNTMFSASCIGTVV